MRVEASKNRMQIPVRIPTQIPIHIPLQIPTQIPIHIPMQVPTRIPIQIPIQNTHTLLLGFFAGIIRF